MSTLNTAVIGCGGRSRAHLPIIRLLSDKYRPVAVCDIDEERAKAVAAEMNAKAYTDVEALLDEEKLDVCGCAVLRQIFAGLGTYSSLLIKAKSGILRLCHFHFITVH